MTLDLSRKVISDHFGRNKVRDSRVQVTFLNFRVSAPAPRGRIHEGATPWTRVKLGQRASSDVRPSDNAAHHGFLKCHKAIAAMARTATWCTATAISRYAGIPTKGAGNKTSFFANATPALTTCCRGLYVLL
jgi:hypothetical protein